MKNIPKNDIKTVILKALKDANFKKKLLENPKKILKEECGISIPENISIQFLEESEKQKYLILPHIPQASGLSEAELEKIAGGVRPTYAATWCDPAACRSKQVWQDQC